MIIKPGTLCMIRGVPQNLPGSEFNGNVVVAAGIKTTAYNASPVYWIEPVLQDRKGRQFTGCRAQWLHPFADPDTLNLNTNTKELETA